MRNTYKVFGTRDGHMIDFVCRAFDKEDAEGHFTSHHPTFVPYETFEMPSDPPLPLHPRWTEQVAKFAKVAAPIFALREWKWAGEHGRYVPTESDIAECAARLVRDGHASSSTSLTTGRIIVQFMDDEMGSIEVGLSLDIS